MDNPLWLFLTLPLWSPTLLGTVPSPLTAIPANSIASVLPGLAMAAARRDGRLRWILFGAVLAQTLVATSARTIKSLARRARIALHAECEPGHETDRTDHLAD
jgi:hypothetical protein